MPVSLPRCLLLADLLLPAAASDHDDTPSRLPGQVTISQANLYPGGNQYDQRRNRFLISSQTAGTIGPVDFDGNYSAFADEASLVSTIGLYLDADRNRLLAAVSDPGYNTARTSSATLRKLAALAIFDATTGARLSNINLGSLRPNAAAHFANDVAVGNLGNSYVTDSFAPFAPIIYTHYL